MRIDKIGSDGSVNPQVNPGQRATPQELQELQKQREQEECEVATSLRTSDDWRAAARSGKVGFLTVMANEDRIPEDRFDEVVASCGDTPQF